MNFCHNKIVLTVLLTLSARGRDSTNVVSGRIANTPIYKAKLFLTLTSLENTDTAVDLYLLYLL